jgi:hypothetical protein
LGLLDHSFGTLGLARALHLRRLSGGLCRASALRFLDFEPLFVASGSQEIGKNSRGSERRFGFGSDRRCRVVAGLKRLRLSAGPTEEPFGLPASLALRSGVSEVLVNIALGEVVRRDQIDPIVLARG